MRGQASLSCEILPSRIQGEQVGKKGQKAKRREGKQIVKPIVTGKFPCKNIDCGKVRKHSALHIIHSYCM